MDVIPVFKMVFGCLLFGLSFYFLRLFVNEIMSFDIVVQYTTTYLSAIVWLFTLLPGLVLIISGYKMLREMEKTKYGGYP